MARLTEQQKEEIRRLKEAKQAQEKQNGGGVEMKEENNNTNVEVVEVKEPEIQAPPTPVLLSSGKWAIGPTTTIHCKDCGAERVIKIQDAFQVTRCTACQKKAANKKRAAKMKAKNQAASLEKRTAEAMELLKSLGLTVSQGQTEE